MAGKVYLVGAGPGKADLITVRGLEVLRQADVIIYDYLVDKVILNEARPDAELICCDKLGKKGRYSNGFSIRQERIHSLVVRKARQGRKVVRLKNGDPAIFGRTSQELEALVKNRIDFEMIPGVTAASAASAFSGIPLTDRRYASSCVFVTGHEAPAKDRTSLDWKGLGRCGTICLYMAFENLEGIVDELSSAGKPRDTPCAIVQNAGLAGQRIVVGTLRDIAVKAKTARVGPPAVVIIGEVVKLEKKFDWLKRGRKILFTGLSKERFFLKDSYVHLPLIKIEPLADYREFDSHLKTLEGSNPEHLPKDSTELSINPERSRRVDWLVFTSRYGVFYFFERLKRIGLDLRSLKGIRIAAIGNSTRNALFERGVLTDLVPKKESSAGLLERFEEMDLRGRKIFLPRSDLSDKGLAEGLKKMGASVTASVAYRNRMPDDIPDLDLGSFDEIVFTSPSGVRNFLKRFGSVPKGIKISCIGEVTKNEAERHHLLD